MKIDHYEIRGLLEDVFQNSEIPEPIFDLKIDDFPEWDSLGNFNLILAFEEKYGVQFDLDEMSNLRSVAAIMAAIEAKRC